MRVGKIKKNILLLLLLLLLLLYMKITEAAYSYNVTAKRLYKNTVRQLRGY